MRLTILTILTILPFILILSGCAEFAFQGLDIARMGMSPDDPNKNGYYTSCTEKTFFGPDTWDSYHMMTPVEAAETNRTGRIEMFDDAKCTATLDPEQIGSANRKEE